MPSFTFFEVSCLITSFISFLFGTFLFLNNRKEKINLFWFLTLISMSLWSLGLFGVVYSTDSSNAMSWQYVLDGSAIFIPLFYFIFILYLLKVEKEYKKIIIISWIIISILFILSFTNLFKMGMAFTMGFNYWVVPGPIYYIFPLIFGFYILYSFFLLYKINKKTTDEVLKGQIKYVTLSQIVGFGGGITNFFPQLFNIYPFGNYLVVVYIFFISYATLKHHLFNVRVIAAELFTFAISIILLVRMLLAGSLREMLIDGIIFMAVAIFGMFFIRSVLQEVRTREELAVANERLKELDKAKSDFVSIASHQLLSPMTAIRGYSSMILEGSYGKVPEKEKTPLERIFLSSKNLVSLIIDFLNLSRIERGKIEYNFKEIDFKEMVRGIVEEFKTINIEKKKGLDLSFDAEEKNFKIKADPDKIRQVVYDLVDNAMKYTKEGFIKISLSRDEKKNVVRLKVEDSGIGIGKEVMEKIFQKFTRAENGAKAQVEGLGLGLYVAKELLEAHRGKIWAESEGEGKGSQFYVELPA